MIYNKEQVMKFLPHRDPFLFIDSVDNIVLDEAAESKSKSEKLQNTDLVEAQVEASFFCREDLPLFAGHFPGNPILPGVIQVEMMAQASCFVMTRIVDDFDQSNLEVALLGVDSSKFRRPVKPGMKLSIKTQCKRVRGGIMTYDCRIEHEGQLMSEATLMASVKY